MAEKPGSAPRSLPEALTRTLRHDVGDLLQTVYATVAILQKRLPPELELERRVLTDLRTRAEGCKDLLDALHDLICPVALTPEPVDLARLAADLVQQAAARYPQVEICGEAGRVPTVTGDGRRLAEVGAILLNHACTRARRQVSFRTRVGRSEQEVEWVVTDDGAAPSAEELSHLFQPFSGGHGRIGLRLALARKLVLLHGGQIRAEAAPEGGACLRVGVPTVPPDDASSRQDPQLFTGV